jgi:NADPH-dependent glutamate synthase beta subunit-like oxidoreductase
MYVDVRMLTSAAPTMAATQPEFEIAIIGGGIAGLACGIALNKLGRKVVVFDKVCAHHLDEVSVK